MPAELATYADGGPRVAPAGTLARLFFDAIRTYDRADALRARAAPGQWRSVSHRTVRTRARHLALGLRALGLARGDRVAILGENRVEWALADWACLTSGLPDVPLYPTLPPAQLPYILNDAGVRALFVSTPMQAAKVAAIRAQVPGLRHVIAFDADARPDADHVLAEVEAAGAAADAPDVDATWEREARAIAPDAVATILYTSGTTGDPKGVALTHDNIWFNVASTGSAVPLTVADVALSFLPLSHIFQRAADYWLFGSGATIAYVDALEAVPACMVEVRPTVAMSVPRLYEKMFARVLERALSAGALRRRAFFWARAVAERWADDRLAGRTPARTLAVQYALAQRLVFSQLRARTGGRLRYFVSGGAPLAPDINKFFFAAGLTILEGYGLTETAPVISVNTPRDFRIGTVGRPVPGVEVRIAEDGEILTRGPHVMRGYWNNPRATAEAIDAEGWFRTGDIGELEDGFLRITDRKKDLIVTAGGKNIAPQPIENRIVAHALIAQAVLVGDRRPYPVVLVVPDLEALERWAASDGLAWRDREALVALPAVRARLEAAVRETLDGLARFETPKKVAVLAHEFTVESGELTPTLKVKRRVVEARHAAVLAALYAGEPPA